MSVKIGLGSIPKKQSAENKFRYFIGRKYINSQDDMKCSSTKLRKYSLRKSEAKRNVLFCCTFQGMTKQILRDSILSDKRILF
jgi:hypothetical protein